MKEFYKAFGIEPRIKLCGNKHCLCKNCDNCMYITKTVKKIIYPPITSDIVLNLATILNKEVFSKIECCCLFCGQSVEEITKNILDDCIDHQKDIYTQVRALFNEL